MIILEMLLTPGVDQEKYIDVIPKRIGAFIGWARLWEDKNYEEKIRELYEKRNKLVHDGRIDIVTIKDLLFTDDLVYDVLRNIINNYKIFKSGKDVVNFAKQKAIENDMKKMKTKQRIKPRLKMRHTIYTEADLLEI